MEFQRGDKIRIIKDDEIELKGYTGTVLHFPGDVDEAGRRYGSNPKQVWITIDGDLPDWYGTERETWIRKDQLERI